MSAALQYFDENLPHRPYHTDDLAFGLRISGKGRALLARYIQQNQPHAQFWLVFDVDREGAAIDWSDRNAPAPNITVKNPVNGHAHLLYALNIAVRTAPDSSVKALKYAAAIERSLCEKLCADVNYSGLIGTVAKLAMRQPFVLFKGLTFQKLCLPGAFRPGDHHNKMLRPGLCVVHAS
ncbi:replication initiation protein, partial [Escherichia coli]|uniref:replication initiation protein n=1 Tax=Escherichia coli TaxID=562 RepID=UPI003CCFFF23